MGYCYLIIILSLRDRWTLKDKLYCSNGRVDEVLGLIYLRLEFWKQKGWAVRLCWIELFQMSLENNWNQVLLKNKVNQLKKTGTTAFAKITKGLLLCKFYSNKFFPKSSILGCTWMVKIDFQVVLFSLLCRLSF